MKKILTAAVATALSVATLSACKPTQNDAGAAADTPYPMVTSLGDYGAPITDNGAADDPIASDDPITQDDPAATEDAGPQYTVSQQNAIESAQSYVDMSGFSKAGLIEQLSSKAGEGFSKADAIFAVNHIKVSWYAEAVESAKQYLAMSSFSRAGLIEQLSSKAGDGFTLAQARYAANKVGLR